MGNTFGLRVPEPPQSPIERLRAASARASDSRDRLEAGRLAALDKFDILDTPPEEAFDRITRLVKKLIGTPIALVSFIDGHRQWHKSHDGLTNSEAPRDKSFACAIVESGEPLVVTDASQDPRFAESPFVTGAPFVRFYAGVPLITDDGTVLGSLSAIDTKPREIDAAQLELLSDLAGIVMTELQLRMLAPRDGLTGAFSRRAFKEVAERATALAIRHHDDLSLLLIDLDRFSAVNSAQGHAVGNRVLKEVARLCTEEMRETDFVGRLGGEVFAILTPKTDLKGASDVAERLRAAVESTPFDVGTGPIALTVSIGVAALDRATRDVGTLLEHAEEGLRSAKEEGRNYVAMWNRPDAAAVASRRRVLKGGLIVFNHHNSTIECTVRSLSDEGAGLDVSSTIGVPPQFELQIKADHFQKACRVVAHSDRHLDVEFDE